MTTPIHTFLHDLDAALVPQAGGERLDLYHIGGSCSSCGTAPTV